MFKVRGFWILLSILGLEFLEIVEYEIYFNVNWWFFWLGNYGNLLIERKLLIKIFIYNYRVILNGLNWIKVSLIGLE